jgi:hypothetical protein
MLIELDQGALHFDVQICGEPAADLERGEGACFNERAPSGLERLFQILAKLAMHIILLLILKD